MWVPMPDYVHSADQAGKYADTDVVKRPIHGSHT